MNIFVSNISFKVREDALSDLFSPFGEVTSVRIIKDKETKRSRGKEERCWNRGAGGEEREGKEWGREMRE